MPLPRTDTIQSHDWPVWVQFNSSSEAFVRHIPLPFDGWLERVLLVVNVIQNGAETMNFSLDGGATLASIVLPNAQPARTPFVTEYTQLGSPIQFARGQNLRMATLGDGTGGNTFAGVFVFRRL